ncbi:glycosyl hydrolase [uncultured Muriicola sp.]|uniref:WD40/YVTN/BNR-like repeat-containing protein n=1 Tax=uncultured Muriicola sp. TaxID=1583102 RepID=UPI00260593AC|nr:glycosyl hydrolase [uncultured Muriicola sp.]
MKKGLLFTLLFLFIGSTAFSQRNRGAANTSTAKEDKLSLAGLQLRNVGPAFLSGRIADIAIHPNDPSTWYVAVGSGGVWKTENSGTTWTPLFDKEVSYSIGCLTIDSNNPSTIWVGTGENVGGRHVAYGDGIYRSKDGGQSWENMGLKNSEHISEIIVHPENPDVIWVASQGPLWNKGGERGLFKSIDGGKSWKNVLKGNEWTGVTDIMMDPRNPDRLYAATWQRHRTVAALMGGGPDSGLHRSEDGGETWEKLSTGLPKSNMGKIGIAISPQQPDVLYAAIELDRTKGAVYRSEDRGSSWKKMSDTVSGGTGPHYYQELYASPHAFDRLYLMNVRILTSDDGGKTFVQLQEEDKHSDNHSIAFRADDPDYLLVGTDAGIYESFDLAQTWRYIKNLPLTQYYKVAVNNQKPFYHIFGGTQDNGSSGGPSRTDERQGIRNAHWYKTLGADGHQSATDPEYNHIIYAETQQGGLHRVDLNTGDQVFIQPQPRAGEPFERYNWDAPILVSPHKASRLYFASYRVWKSEDRGNSWSPISGDLTRNEERITLPIMGKQQSWDNAWDVGAMSNYNTITSLSESPVKAGVLYAGTDDGYIQVSSDDGGNWRRIAVSSMGLPSRSFVNDIKADLFDENTVYVALDNHKEGDFSTYVFKSSDKGVSWRSIKGDLPANTIIWRLVQDHVNKNLLFAGTEKGIYTSMNGGVNWHKVPGAPTISFRDLVIQKEENDLVGASFGRGFFVLDDYSALREMTEATLSKEGSLYSTREADWYVPKNVVGNTGADYYFAKNPEFGALFTYSLANEMSTKSKDRKENEKALEKRNASIPFVGWDALEEERRQEDPTIWITIKDANNNVIRNVEGSTKKGLNRVAWDLRHPSTRAIRPGQSGGGGNSWWNSGPMAMPGTYTATLSKEVDGVVTQLDGPISFEVTPLFESTLKGISYDQYNAYINEYNEVQTQLTKVSTSFDESMNKVKAMQLALSRANAAPGSMNTKLHSLKQSLYDFEERLEGNKSKDEIGERTKPSVGSHLSVARRGMSTTYGPTPLHKENLNIAKSMLNGLYNEIRTVANTTIPQLEKELKAMGAPYIIGQGID